MIQADSNKNKKRNGLVTGSALSRGWERRFSMTSPTGGRQRASVFRHQWRTKAGAGKSVDNLLLPPILPESIYFISPETAKQTYHDGSSSQSTNPRRKACVFYMNTT